MKEGHGLSGTSGITLQKQGCQSFKKTIEDDILVEKINTGLFLFLGVVLLATSALLVVYSAVLVIYRHEFLMELLKTLIFVAPFSAIGLGLLYYLFQKRRIRKLEKSLPLGLAPPQCIVCGKCGEILYEGEESTSPYEIIKSCGGRCPECGEELECGP